MVGSAEQQVYAASRRNLREYARRFSKILVQQLRDGSKMRHLDPVELRRLGENALESIEFRRSLLERRRGPKWREENELRRMERQVWRLVSRLAKKSRDKSPSLDSFSKELKRVMDATRNRANTIPSH